MIGMDVSLSSESASLAAMLSSRSLVIARADGRISLVDPGQRVADGGADVREHRLVEVDATEALDALRLAERLEPVGGARMMAASKVPPPRSYTATTSPTSRRSSAAKCTAAASGSVTKRGCRARPLRRLLEQLDLVRTPVGRVRDGHGVRGPAEALGDLWRRPAGAPPPSTARRSTGCCRA